MKNDDCPNMMIVRNSPHLSLLGEFGCHDDDAAVLIPDHPPEIDDGLRQATLGGNVRLLHRIRRFRLQTISSVVQ